MSPGCASCYAETLSLRNPSVLGGWGPGAPRASASESYWKQPEKWFKAARLAGVRHKVFCLSLGDLFDAEAPTEDRKRLWGVIQATSGYLDGRPGGLDWLLLTKRPERIGDVMCEDRLPLRFFMDNFCWLGVSIESQKYTGRFWTARHWSNTPWISAEPLLGPLDMPNILDQGPEGGGCKWVVVGAESGAKARPMHPAWARSIRDQCQGAGVAFFFKQWGEFFPSDMYDLDTELPRLTGKTEVYVGPNGEVQQTASRFEHGCPCDVPHGYASMVRVGKKFSGDLLDGRQWHEFPKPKVPA